MRYHVATSISSGQNIMMEWHNVARPDEILRRDGISLVCNMSAQWSSDKYRSRLDCLHWMGTIGSYFSWEPHYSLQLTDFPIPFMPIYTQLFLLLSFESWASLPHCHDLIIEAKLPWFVLYCSNPLFRSDRIKEVGVEGGIANWQSGKCKAHA